MTDNFEKLKEEAKKDLSTKIIKSENLSNLDIPEVEFVVERLIPKKAITFITGNPSSGKSWLMLEVSKSVASGELFFDKFKTLKGNVLYIDEESPLSEVKRRWLMLEARANVDFLCLEGIKIDNQSQREKLLELVDSEKYDLIIFDSLRDLHSKNENDSKEAQDLIDAFREFTRKDVAVLISHHNRKESFLNSREPSQILRGSSALLAGIDSLLAVDSEKKNEETIEYIITQAKLRQGKTFSPFKIALIEQEGKMKFNFIGEIEDEVRKLDKTKQAILNLLSEGEKYQEEIKTYLIPQYFAAKTIERAIKELKGSKEIEPRKGEGRRIYLRLVA